MKAFIIWVPWRVYSNASRFLDMSRSLAFVIARCRDVRGAAQRFHLVSPRNAPVALDECLFSRAHRHYVKNKIINIDTSIRWRRRIATSVLKCREINYFMSPSISCHYWRYRHLPSHYWHLSRIVRAAILFSAAAAMACAELSPHHFDNTLTWTGRAYIDFLALFFAGAHFARQANLIVPHFNSHSACQPKTLSFMKSSRSGISVKKMKRRHRERHQVLASDAMHQYVAVCAPSMAMLSSINAITSASYIGNGLTMLFIAPKEWMVSGLSSTHNLLDTAAASRLSCEITTRWHRSRDKFRWPGITSFLIISVSASRNE